MYKKGRGISMRNELFRKGLVFAIIVLFIGAGVVPSISGNNGVNSVINAADNIPNTISRTTIYDGSLSGYVNDTCMNPIEGARVRVYFHGTYEENYSDSSGYYHVTNIPICYCLKNATASKEGYKTEWVMLSITENTTYDFVLTALSCYPVFNGTMGENDWYTGGIWIFFNYDPNVVAEIWYRIDDGEWMLYTEPFYYDEDGEHTLEYYFVDYEGHESAIFGPFAFKIDQTDPIIELTVEKIGSNTWLFTADVFDETSGVNRVEFYVDGEFVGEVTEAPYEWEYSGTVREVGVVVYDNAGNQAIRIHRSFRLFLEQFPRIMPVVGFTDARATLDKSVFDDIKIEDTSGCDCELGCELEIGELTFDRYRITMIIKNIGDSDCTNVKWNITLEGGIILIGKETTGIIICIPPGENVTVRSGFILGFGRTVITGSAEGDEGSSDTKDNEAFIWLFWVYIIRMAIK